MLEPHTAACADMTGAPSLRKGAPRLCGHRRVHADRTQERGWLLCGSPIRWFDFRCGSGPPVHSHWQRSPVTVIAGGRLAVRARPLLRGRFRCKPAGHSSNPRWLLSEAAAIHRPRSTVAVQSEAEARKRESSVGDVADAGVRRVHRDGGTHPFLDVRVRCPLSCRPAARRQGSRLLPTRTKPLRLRN